MDWTTFARYAAPIIALFVGAWLNRYLERRPKLTAYLSHAGAVQVRPQDQPTFSVHTHTVVIRNSGKLKATNVRLGHNSLPSFSLFPNIQHEVVNLPGGGAEIVFPALVPDEQVVLLQFKVEGVSPMRLLERDVEERTPIP